MTKTLTRLRGNSRYSDLFIGPLGGRNAPKHNALWGARSDRVCKTIYPSQRAFNGIGLAAITAVAAAPAQAAPIQYVWVQNGGLTGSVSVEGSFTYDSTTKTVTDLDFTFDDGPPMQRLPLFWEGTYTDSSSAVLGSHFGQVILQFAGNHAWAGSSSGNVHANVAIAFVDFVDGGPNYLASGAAITFDAGPPLSLSGVAGPLDNLNPPYVVAQDSASTPEPATSAMMLAALAGVGARMWKAGRRRILG